VEGRAPWEEKRSSVIPSGDSSGADRFEPRSNYGGMWGFEVDGFDDSIG
jgi:hypothetical protein